jgi:hypothetical protein
VDKLFLPVSGNAVPSQPERRRAAVAAWPPILDHTARWAHVEGKMNNPGEIVSLNPHSPEDFETLAAQDVKIHVNSTG